VKQQAAASSGLGVPSQITDTLTAEPGAVIVADQDVGSGTAAPAPAVLVTQPRPEPAGEITPREPAAAPATARGQRHRPAAPPVADLFTRYTRDYVAGREGQQVVIVQAGCTTADTDLGAAGLAAAGADILVSLIDDSQPVTAAAAGANPALAGCVQGDLRTLPLPPRSADIVLCPLLLQRIKHTELVLDRLVAAIKPGGLLLLRFRDRDSAAGFLDRVLPALARQAIWRRRRPGQPGPYPAVYERLSSVRGVQAYAMMRGLVIAERRALGGLPGPPGFRAAQSVIAWLSRGRLTSAHEDLLYVLRKPENRFARVI
jgi:trans-aconitate methyltransferase